MDEESLHLHLSLATLPSYTTLKQAITAIKKGAYLLKIRRRGRPKVCPFRLSSDEKFLIWYSGKEEKQLKLYTVTSIFAGQRSENFQKHPQPEKVSQSFSIIYADGERSLDLVCKDKVQAGTWFLGLKSVISKFHLSRPSTSFRSCNEPQTCVNSPAGIVRRKHHMGFDEARKGFYQGHSLCGSPSPSLPERCLSKGLSCCSESLYSSESAISWNHNATDYGNLKDVMIWGEGVAGNLGGGNGTQSDCTFPLLIQSAMTLDVMDVSLGGRHAALVTKSGEVFCWGEANKGKLGHKVDIDMSYPKVVESLNRVHVKSVACGEFRTCALTVCGEIYTWGENDRSQWLPCKVLGLLDGVRISFISCGLWHTAMVSTSRLLFTFGDGTFGVLGHGDLQCVSHPKEVKALRGLSVESVACGPWHTAAIVGGKLFTWGDGDKGRLGHGDQQRKLLPACVVHLRDHKFVSVSCGRMLTVALTSFGKVYAMGSSVHGQLGNQQARDESITIVQGKLENEFVRQIATGSYHTIVLTSGGHVYAWGKGASGQLGLGDTKDRSLPTLVEAISDRKVVSISCGSNITAAICIHKSISVSDQLSCSRCRTLLGFMRKKHNCYNCGLVFCHTCSSKKVSMASLAADTRKLSRVCDACFDQLQNGHPDRLKLEISYKRQLLTPQSKFLDEKEAGGRLTPNKPGRIEMSSERQNLENVRVDRKGLPSVPTPLPNLQQSGQVLLPFHQETYCNDDHVVPTPDYKIQLRSLHVSGRPLGPSSLKCSNYDISKPDKSLIEEVSWLRSEARNLEEQCLISNQKIQECQRKLEETWTRARDEGANYTAAKEVIRALATRLHRLSKKPFAGTGMRDGLDEQKMQITPLYMNSQNMKGISNMCLSIHLPDKMGIMKEPQVNSSYSTLAVLTKTIHRTNDCSDNTNPQNEDKETSLEWAEQYEPGVYLTFATLSNLQKGLKRVRFSRKHFSEKEAEDWWELNQSTVYEKYGIEEYTNLNSSGMKSNPPR